jgi:hypothetical protein
VSHYGARTIKNQPATAGVALAAMKFQTRKNIGLGQKKRFMDGHCLKFHASNANTKIVAEKSDRIVRVPLGH